MAGKGEGMTVEDALKIISCWPQPWQTATSMKDYQIWDGNGDVIARFERSDIRDAFFSLIPAIDELQKAKVSKGEEMYVAYLP